MRRQFVLDRKSNKLLEELAVDRGGNRSLVVREAIKVYAEVESSLDQLETDPEFLKMMERSAADIRAGRVVTQSEAKTRLRAAREKK